MRYRLTCCFVFCFVFLCLGESLADTESKRTVRVGYFRFAGFNDYDSHGGMRGYGYEYLQALARYTNWRYEFVTRVPEKDGNGLPTGRMRDITFADCLEMLKRGEIDLLGSVRRDVERERFFAFPAREAGNNFGMLTCRSDDLTRMASINSWDKVVIGVLHGSTRNAEFLSYCGEQGISNFTLREYPTYEAMWKALHVSREVDGLLSSSLRKLNGEQVILRYGADAHYIVANRNNEALLQELNEAQEQLALYDWGLRDRLFRKYYSDGWDNLPVFTQEEKAVAAKLEPLRVACNINQRPYMYLCDGVCKGFPLKILTLIGEMSGLRFKFLPADSANEALLMVREGRADMVAGLESHDSLSGIHQSPPYLVSPVNALSNTFDIDPKNPANVVALVRGGILPYFVDPQGKNVRYYDTVRQCLESVKEGKADIAFVDSLRSYFYQSNDSFESLVPQRLIGESHSLCFGVGMHCSPDVYKLILKALNRMPPQLIQEMLDENLAHEHSLFSLRSWLNHHLWLSFLVMVFLFAIVFCMFHYGATYRLRQRQNIVLRRKNRELEKAKKEAEKLDRARNAFLARMSHEIRTPLNSIIGMSHVAAMHADQPGRVRDCMDKLDVVANYLRDILNDILDFSALSRDGFELSPHPFAVVDVVDTLADIFTELYKSKNIVLRISCDCPPRRRYLGDARRISQVLSNLLSNAAKFTSEGGEVSLSVRECGCNDREAVLEFVVQDSGNGMDEDCMRRMFVPFSQADEGKDAADRQGGGFGLSVVRELVNSMSGTVDVSSEPGRGTCFTIAVPLPCVEEDAEASSFVAGKGMEEHPTWAGGRALVAEDNEIDREIMRGVLNSYGIEVDICHDGREALERFTAAAPGHYDIVFEDIRMPRMDGYESAAAIRACGHPDARTTPIVAYSVNAYEEDKKLSASFGMNGHLAKPLEIAELEIVLKRFLGAGGKPERA